jgi:hypothetical protein
MSGIQGEAKTGYSEDGPFRCGACEYFRAGSCGQSTMMAESTRKKTKDGRILVSADGCCTYFQKAKKEHKVGKRMMSWRSE